MSIKISSKLTLPNEAATQKLGWIGTTGSGKTYGASKFAEGLWNIGAQFVVLDPVGVWWGMRLQKDGKKPSKINIPIFGGLHGDVPLEATGGELIANLIIDNNLSCIIDVSQFESDADKARFATAFANRFFFRKKAAPSAVHLFIEECQEFVPQNPQREENHMLHAFVRMQKLGRNFGIGSSYITQRPQEVSKKALNMAQTLFVFRTTGHHERKAIEEWTRDKSLEQDLIQDLPKIETGHCHVWSPEFLKMSNMIQISEKETFNASATPEVGKAAKARTLAAIDLGVLQKEMAATIEKAKQDDPKELKKQIEALRKEIGAEKKKPVFIPGYEEELVGKAVSKAIALRDKEWLAILEPWKVYGKRLREVHEKIAKAFSEFIPNIPSNDIPQAPTGSVSPAKSASKYQENAPRVGDTKMLLDQGIPHPRDELSKPEQRILDAIAWMNSIGVEVPEQTAVAFLAGYTFGSGGFNNPKGALRSKGLVEYVEGNKIRMTDNGRHLAITPNGSLTSEELHDKVLERLETPHQRILKPLLEANGESMSKESLAEASGYKFGSGGFNNPLGRLRSLGLIEYLPGGEVRARDILFV